MQCVGEQRVRAECGGDAGVDRGGVRGGFGYVALDVLAAAEQQGDEDGGLVGQCVEGVGEQWLVQFDVAQPDDETGPQLADAFGEGGDGGEGAGVAAAVGDEDEGGAAVRCGAAVEDTRLSWLRAGGDTVCVAAVVKRVRRRHGPRMAGGSSAGHCAVVTPGGRCGGPVSGR